MEIIRRSNKCITLLEVILAVVIFAIFSIPLYRAISTSAVKEIDTTKLSMARKILESVKSELQAKSFNEIENMIGSNNQTFVKISGGYPNTLSEVLNIQSKYKDFHLEVFGKFSVNSKSIIEIKAVVSYTSSQNRHKNEEINFLIIKP